MNQEELFADLKQFIEATVSQQVAHLATKEEIAVIRRTMATKEDIANLRTEFKTDIRSVRDDLKLLDEKLDTIHEAIADTVQDHEQRIHRLERRAA